MPSSTDNETWEKKKNERNLVKNPFWVLCSIHEIFASLEHADVWRFTVITQQRSQLKLSIYSDPPALLFIVSQREKPFASVLLFISFCAALGDIYADFCFRAVDNKMKTFNFFSEHFLSSSTCVGNIRATHVRLFVCVFFACESENFYHTQRNLRENLVRFLFARRWFHRARSFFGSCTAHGMAGAHGTSVERGKPKKTPRIVSLIINGS